MQQTHETTDAQTTEAAVSTAVSLIDGDLVDGSGVVKVRCDPADPGRVVTTYREATSHDLQRTLAAAAAAAAGWDEVGIIARGKILSRIADLIRENAEELAATMTAEHGKPLAESQAEVALSAETFDYHAGGARDACGRSFPSSRSDEWITTVRRPLGIVATITPWNFPLQIPAWKIAPALLHGNVVVWKSASHTHGVASILARLAVEAGVPRGVLSLLLGNGRLGAELVASPQVNAVTFTGSVPVGHAIRDAATRNGAKLQLELGGHNAAIVLPDAPVELAADNIIAGAMGSTGQKCTATRRVILVGEGHEDLIEGLCERTRKLKLGAGTVDGTEIGPIVSEQARQEAVDALHEAVAQGATVLASAEIPDAPGHWVAPTVLSGEPNLRIAHEEVFAPITLVLRAPDLTSAVELANDTEFGLSAAVFTRDEASVRYCLAHLDAGVIKVNAPSTGTELHGPFSGMKNSTFAGPREQNREATAAFFTQEKTAYLRLAPGQ